LLPVCFIHYGIILAYVMLFLSCRFADDKKLNKFLRNRVVIIVVLILGLIGVQSAITLIIPYTRFSYYLDSVYLQGKSISSIIYATISFCAVYYFYRKFSWRQIEKKDKVIILFALLLTLFIVITSPIAVLSGRYLLFYIFMEGFLASVVVKYDRKTFTILLLISILKWISIINQGILTL
ncbi:EpsG family protein, partial [Citrobacter portucalensis]|uniref:EpsG family protein n=1 Tax=Citrobacter portucalensis TaxID=1639133 RepID=UPI00226B7452